MKCHFKGCAFKAKNANLLQDHIRDEHGTNNSADRIYKCHYKGCTFNGKRSDLLKVHINEVHEKKLKTCINCGKNMTSSSLSRHKRNNICIREIPSIVSEQKVNISIETEVTIRVHSDGSVKVEHPKGVQIGPLTLYLTTSKPGNIFLFSYSLIFTNYICVLSFPECMETSNVAVEKELIKDESIEVDLIEMENEA